MNNNDFRALLSKNSAGSSIRTTKEIARAAVENEFSKKKRGDGGGGRSRRQRSSNDDDVNDDSNDSGSSDEDAASNKKNEKTEETLEQLLQPEWKRRRKEKKLRDAASAGIAPISEYRDRAKERREGANADYALLDVGSGSSLINQPQSTRDTTNGNGNGNDEDDNRKRRVELSKYLGGDEEHTHLVKGLDKALAEKVRREENMTRRMQSQQSSIDGTLDLDEILEDAYNNNTQKEEQQKSDWRSTNQTTSELGTSMLNYLLQKEQRSIHSSTSAAASAMNPSAVAIQHCNISSSSTLMVQRSIQQTVYNFDLTSNVHQRHVAWEVPQICILPTTSRMTSGSRRDISPLSKDIIMAIKKKLDSRASSSSLTNSNEKSKCLSASHDVSRKKKLTMKEMNREEETAGVHKSDGRGRYNDDIIHDGESGGNNDDDDSDIFDNVGTYAPMQQQQQQEEDETD